MAAVRVELDVSGLAAVTNALKELSKSVSCLNAVCLNLEHRLEQLEKKVRT